MKMKMRIISTALLLAAGGFTTQAAETYQFDQSHSTIGFAIHQFLGTTHGKFTKFEGKIELDRERPQQSSVVTRIQVRSIDTGIEKRDNHLRSPEFFNVEKFPEITFKSRSVQKTGPETGDISGDLSIHGVTKPITLHVKLLTPASDTNKTRWVVTTEPIQRRDFNLLFSSSAEAISGISQSVSINIEIEAQRAE